MSMGGREARGWAIHVLGTVKRSRDDKLRPRFLAEDAMLSVFRDHSAMRGMCRCDEAARKAATVKGHQQGHREHRRRPAACRVCDVDYAGVRYARQPVNRGCRTRTIRIRDEDNHTLHSREMYTYITKARVGNVLSGIVLIGQPACFNVSHKNADGA